MKAFEPWLKKVRDHVENWVIILSHHGLLFPVYSNSALSKCKLRLANTHTHTIIVIVERKLAVYQFVV